jgi:DNA anti-recombination protein RmuC
LDNAARVNELLRQGLDEVEDSRKRQTSEFREIKASLEDKVASLTNENTRLQADLLYERNESKHQMELLKQELAKLHKGMQRLEEGSSDS